MTRHVIRVITDPTQPEAGPLVSYYNPDADGGRGAVRLTVEPTEAATFDTAAEAAEFYRQTSTVRPTRPDGQPNRPLTAYTVMLDTLEP